MCLIIDINVAHRVLVQEAELDRAGRARIVKDELIQNEVDRIVTQGLCCSNDHHIIALALVGKVRLLCSLDHDLHTDFKNPRLLAKPRGKVYLSANHNRLLQAACKEK